MGCVSRSALGNTQKQSSKGFAIVSYVCLLSKYRFSNHVFTIQYTFFSKNNVDSDFMLLEHCQEILIKEITKQPTNGMIHINKDRRSVRYDTGAYTIADVGVQYFKYSVEISPSTVNQLVHEGEVTLDFRGKPMIFTPVCMAKEQELPLTKER